MNQEETKSLYDWICKNQELKDQLSGIYKYKAADTTYHVSLCKRSIKNSWLAFHSSSRILLYLVVKQNLIDIEVGFIDIDYIKMTWINDQGNIKINFDNFLSNTLSKDKAILLKNTQLSTNFVFQDQKVIFFQLKEKFIIWLNDSENKKQSREQFISWKCLIVKYFPYIGLPGNIINHNQLFSDLLNRYKQSTSQAKFLQNTVNLTDGWPKNKIIEILLKELQDKYEIISTQRQKKREKDDFELKINKNELKLKQAKDAIDNLSKKLEESVKMCENFEKENNELKIKLNRESQLKIQAEKEIERTNQINKKAESAIQQLQEKFAQKERLILGKFEKENNELKFKLNRESQLKIQAEKNIERKNQIIKKAENTIQQLQEKLDQKERILSEKIQSLEQIQNAYKENIILEEKVNKQLLEMKQNNINLELEQYLHIFEGQVLKNCICEKQYLRSEIEKYTDKKVLMTNLLYRCDPLNKTNYHVYIDGHPHLALLLRLKNQRLIAGYSVGPIIENTSTTEGGLILSLTAQKSFELLPGKKSVSYDTFFLIFGNSELRLKHADTTFFTNFGIANSFYNHRGEKHTVLTGGQPNSREEDIETYEVFEVIFR